MSVFTYLKNSFARKKARKQFQQYSTRVDTFQLKNGETVEFANWLNPLIKPKQITQREIDFFRKYISPGSFCVDIGANIGDVTVPMAIAAGAEGLVLGFDPNPQVFRVLEVNARLNAGKANIVPVQLAATEKNREFYFASSEASMSNGGLIEDFNDNRHGRFKHKEPIKGVNLGEYLQEFYAGRLHELSLIKLDAEGFDYFILTTLIPVVEKYQPTIIMEVYHGISAQTRSNIFSLLKKFKYSILNISAFESNMDFTPTPINSLDEMPKLGNTENIIAFPDHGASHA